MTIEEISKEIPFKLDFEKFKTKEEITAAFCKHLSIVATKAECIGDKKLTEALDIMRKYFPDLNHLTKSEDAEWTEASNIIKFYINRFSDEGKEEEQMMKDDILSACQEAEDKYKEYLSACKEARALEKEYRTKYSEPSGMMREDFYKGTNEDEDI